MNEQERDQLNRFLQQLVEVKLSSKDSEAERLISEALTRQPDAAYLLVQRSLLLEQAVNHAQAQIRELQAQRPAASGGGFLGGDPWRPATGNAVPGASNYQVPSTGGTVNAAPAAGLASGASSFLGNVATTAAGVVAGSFLFQGIESLLGHHASPSPWGGQSGFGGAEHFSEQTVINNYYGDNDPSTTVADNQDFLSSDDNDNYLPDGEDGDSDWV